MTEHPSRLIALVADAISRNPCDRDDPDSRHLASGCRTAIAVLDALAATTANYYNGATQTRSTTPGVPTPQNDPARPPFATRTDRSERQEQTWHGQTPNADASSKDATNTAPPATTPSPAPQPATSTAPAPTTTADAPTPPGSPATPPTTTASHSWNTTPSATPGAPPSQTPAAQPSTSSTPCNACRHRPHPGSICSADLDGPTGSRWAHPCGCAGPDDTHEPAPCPDCAAGKHTACAGDSWDEQHDQPAPCPCNAAGHSTQEHRA